MNKKLLFRLFALLAAMMCALGASAAEAYANYTSSNTTLTFYYDNQRSSRTGTTYDLNTGENAPGWYNDGNYANVTKAVFNSSFTGARPTTTFSWFYSMRNLQSITGLSYLNTSEVTNMRSMFRFCESLTSLDVSNFNTAKVTSMEGMFSFCRGLTSLDLSSFNTSKVTDMSCMFGTCSGLTSLDLSSFNTSKVTNMSWMFASDIYLRTIFVGSGWSTAAVSNSNNMFYYCTILVGGKGTSFDENHIDAAYAHVDGGPSNPGYFTDPNAPEAYACYTSSNTTLTFYYDDLRSTRTGTTYDLPAGTNSPTWDTDEIKANATQVVFDPSFANARPTSTHGWFYEMSKLQSITGMEYLNTSEVTDMSWMFGYCSGLTSLDLSSFNTAKVTDMPYMFYSCYYLETIYVSDGWSTTAVTYSYSMFDLCVSLVGGNGTTYDSDHVDAAYAHVDGGPSNPGYFTDPNAPEAYACYTSSNTTLTFYYDDLRSTRTGTTYDVNRENRLPAWITEDIKANATKAVFDPSFAGFRPTTTYGWFYQMENLQTVSGMAYLNTSEVTKMDYMFQSCSSLTSLDLSRFNTANVTEMDFMFYSCTGLTSLDLHSFNTKNVTDMFYMFAVCRNLETIYVGNDWSTAAVTESSSMFFNCPSLVGGQGTTYDANHTDAAYAHVDGGTSNPGYFTAAQNYDFVADGIYYRYFGGNQVAVTFRDDTYGCYSGEVVIPETVTYDGWTYIVTCISERAFYRCPYLTKLTIPSTVERIESEAFVDAFMDASNSSITCMAETPPSISPTALDDYYTGSMTLYVVPGSKTAYESANYWNQFGTIVELPYSFVVNGIYYKKLSSNTVSVSYKDSNYNTYSGNVVIPETVSHNGVTYTVTKVDNVAFFNCPDLTSVVIPETVTAIGNTTFKWCTSLTKIVIPNSVTTIGLYAFQGCTALKDVIIGSGVTSIGSYAFNGCTALELGNITCKAIIPPTIKSNTFDSDHYHGANLYVPKGSLVDYEQAQYWCEFWDVYEFWSLDDALNEEGGTLHFESTGDYPWTVIEGGDGTHYAQSGNAGVHNSTSTMTATVVIPSSGANLCFLFKAWGESNSTGTTHYDKCIFAVDGETWITEGALQNDWQGYSIDLPAGTHMLTWRYTKDGSVNPTGDYFAIDNVILTPNQTVTLGDVNGDGFINPTDATVLINALLNENFSAVNQNNADMDGNGIVNITDAIQLINMLLTL